MSGIEAPRGPARPKDFNWVEPDFDPRAPVRRWTHIKKLALMVEIRRGGISEAEAREIHGVSEDEMAEWRARLDQYGVDALKITRQPWREPEPPGRKA